MLIENLQHHSGCLYELLAWCVMPNHVHLLIQPFETTIDPTCEVPLGDETADRKSPLSRIMHSLKSYTANRANEILGREGRFWQPESYDHWVRDLNELERMVEYIRFNPVKAGLCETPEAWKLSSTHERYGRDGSRCGLVGWLRDDWINQG